MGSERGRPAVASLALDDGTKLGLGLSPDDGGRAGAALWLYTDDVDEAVRELRAAGVPVSSEPADQVWGERTATVVDPDGHDVHIGAPV